MRWSFAFGWLCRTWEQRRKRQPARRWVKFIQPRLEPLEKRFLLTNNVWLPQQLAAFDGTTQTNIATQLFQPATTTLLPQLALQGTSVSVSAQASLTDSGNYQLALTQDGPYDNNGDRYTFTASGPVSFSLSELGSVSAGGFSINSLTLSQTATLSWSLVETNSSGQTVQNLSGVNVVSASSSGAAPFDPFFPQGFNWLPLAQQVSSVNSLGLASLSADSLSVTESNGSDSRYTFQETDGVATVQDTVQQPLSVSLMQSGQQSYSETAVEQFNSSNVGGDSFSLTELGSYSNGSYALSSISYSETNGSQTWQFNATVSDSQNGSGSSSGVQSFSGNNQSLGDSSGESFHFNDVSTLSYGETAASAFALTQQGSYGGGCFSLDSLSYNANGSGGYSLTQTSLQTQTGSFSGTSSDSGANSYSVDGTLTDSGTATEGGNFTNTMSGTLHDNESGNFTVSMGGGYGNGSWSLSSFRMSDSLSGTFSLQQLGTLTQSGNGTASDSSSGSDTFLLNFGLTNNTSGGDTSSSSDTSSDSFTQSSTSSSTQSGASTTTLSEQGVWQGGSVSLSSFVFTSGQNGTYSANGTNNETDNGSGQDTASGSDSSTQSASNGSFNDNLSGNDSFTASDSFSFTSTDSTNSSDSGGFNQSVYQAGVFSNGSYSLSSVANQSSRNDNWSDTSTDSSTDSGSDSDSDGSGNQINDTVQFGGACVTDGGGDCFSDSDSGTFVDTSFDTITNTGYLQWALTQVGSYGQDSFSFTTVTYQSNDTSNGTTQESDDDNFTDTVNDGSSDTSSDGSIDCLTNSTSTMADSGGDTNTDTFTDFGLGTLTETLTSTDTSSAVEIGSFLGGVWNLSIVSLGDSSSDSFSTQDLDSSTDSGTDCFTSNDSLGGGDTNVYGGGSLTDSNNSNDTSSGSDTFSDHDNDTVTDSGSDSFSMSEQGMFANYSFALSSVVYQGGDSISDTAVESSTGTSVGVETDSFTDGSGGNGVGTYAFGSDSTSYNSGDSGSDTLTTGSSDSLSETTTSSETDSFYEAGQFIGGSLSLSLVSYSSGGNDSWNDQSSDTSMDSGTVNDSGSDSGNAQLQMSGGSSSQSVSDSSAESGNDSATSYDSSTDSGSDSWSLFELGSFVNGSYSYSSFVSSDGGSDNDTLIDSSTDSFSGTVSDGSGSGASQGDDGSSGYDNVSAQGGDDAGSSDSFNENDLGRSTDTVLSYATWSDYSAGVLSGNSWNLSSVSQSSSGSDTWNGLSNDTISDNGLETISGGMSFSGGDSVNGFDGSSATSSGTDSSSGTLGGTDTSSAFDSSTDSGTDSWSQVEQGSYSGYSYAFSSVVFQSGDSSSDCIQDDATDTFLGSLSSGDSGSGQVSGSDSVSSVSNYGGSDNGQSSSGGNVTDTESIDSQDTVTGGDSENSSDYESGTYSGGSYAFSSFSYQDSDSDSSTDNSLGTSYGSLSGSGNAANTLSGDLSWDVPCGATGSPTPVADNVSAGWTDNATGTSTGGDTGSDSVTVQSGDCWSLTELGSYGNGSYSLSSYVSSSSDSNSVNALDTDSVTETVTATGSGSDGSGECNTAWVQGTWTSSVGSPTSGTFGLNLDDSTSDDAYGSFTETTTATDTNTESESATFSESEYQAGVYSAGSFSLSSVVYNMSSSDSVTEQSSDTYVSLETQQENTASDGSQDGYNVDGYNASDNSNGTLHDTVTGGDTVTEQSQSSESVYQAGCFSNDSYSLSSYSFSAQGSDTVTSSSSDTFTSLNTGSDSGLEDLNNNPAYNGSDSFTETVTGGDSSAATQTDGWSLSEQGSLSAGSLSLSCYVLSVQESSSNSSTDSSAWSETLTGTDDSVYTYTGGDSGSANDSQISSSNGALLEQGTAVGDVLSLSLVSYSGSGSENGSASDGASGSWSGASYSGGDTDNAQSGDSGSYSVSALGSYSNGSFSLSSYVVQGSSSDSSSQSASETDTLNLSGGGCLGSSIEHFSRGDTASAGEMVSLYQSGVETAGSYANVSYSSTDDSSASASQQASSPYNWSIDNWQTGQTQTESLGGGTLTCSSSFDFQDSNYSGSATNSVTEALTLTAPGLLVDLPLPDASSVAVVGADETSGGMPVSMPNVAVAGEVAAWLLGTGASVQAATQPNRAMPLVPPGGVGAPTQTPGQMVHIEGCGPAIAPIPNAPVQGGDFQIVLLADTRELRTIDPRALGIRLQPPPKDAQKGPPGGGGGKGGAPGQGGGGQGGGAPGPAGGAAAKPGEIPKDIKQEIDRVNVPLSTARSAVDHAAVQADLHGRLRDLYHKGDEAIRQTAEQMRQAGMSKEAVENYRVQARNDLKTAIRKQGNALVDYYYQNHPRGAGDKPTVDQLRRYYRKKYPGISENELHERIMGSGPQKGVDKIARALKIGGRIAIIADVAAGTYRVITAPDGQKLKQALREAARIEGAIAGGEAGAWAGAAIGGWLGSFFPGAGNLIGAGVGGIIGGIAGAISGGLAAEKAMDSIVEGR